MKIQLALQGGGARIISLLGAASGIQALRDPKRLSKQLQITRVMGTSAGAIVGAMIAANVDIDQFHKKLEKNYRTDLLKDLKQGWAGTNVRQVMFGTPYWKSDSLERILKETFNAAGVKTVSDVKEEHGVDLRVVATDLEAQEPVVYSSSNEKGTEAIEKALMHSCAIPFYFRSWKHPTSIVDGGIVQNFPCEELIDLEAESGKAFGISFEPHPRSKHENLKGYALSLLDTAMESATKEAKLKLERRIFELPYKYETLDFEGAFSDEGLGEHFKRCKELTFNWFEKRIEYPHTYITEDFWSHQSRDTSSGLVNLYRTHEQKCKIEYDELNMAVTAYGLNDPLLPDRTVTRLVFRTTNETMYYHRISLSETSLVSNLKSSNIQLTDATREIGLSILPMIDPSTAERKEILIAFHEALPPHSGPYTLVIVDSVLGLTGLLALGKDEIATSGERTISPIKRCEVMIHLPHRFKDGFRMAPLDVQPGQVAGGRFNPPWNPDKHEEGFFTIGWEGSNVLPTQDFGFKLELDVVPRS